MDAAALVIGAAVGALSSAAVSAITAVVFTRRIRVQAMETQATRDAVDRLTHAVAGTDAWYWTPEWQEREQQADDDLASDRSAQYSSLEDFEEALDAAASRLATSA